MIISSILWTKKVRKNTGFSTRAIPKTVPIHFPATYTLSETSITRSMRIVNFYPIFRLRLTYRLTYRLRHPGFNLPQREPAILVLYIIEFVIAHAFWGVSQKNFL
jgi:hypothetical protein